MRCCNIEGIDIFDIKEFAYYFDVGDGVDRKSYFALSITFLSLDYISMSGSFVFGSTNDYTHFCSIFDSHTPSIILLIFFVCSID
jgi:hypothetical protein